MGSTDDTIKVLRRMENEYSNLRVVELKK